MTNDQIVDDNTGDEETGARSRTRSGGAGAGADEGEQFDAAGISEAVYRSMLPSDERAFRAELEIWHPSLDADRYLARRGYPRCWVFTAALVFAVGHTEYARALLESLRRTSTRLATYDVDHALRFAVGDLSGLEAESWRATVCTAGGGLWFFGPQTMTRAFGLGLTVAFVSPETARNVVDLVQRADPGAFERQLAAARHVMKVHPLSLILTPTP